MKLRFKRVLCLLLCVAVAVLLIPQPGALAGYADGYAGGMAGDDCGIYAHGVDLSNWQGHEVDFNQIKAQGYSFVILRAGFATTEDDTFENNYTRAKAAGLDVGVYLYSYAATVEEVLKESAALKTWLSGKVLEYPVYFDMEDPNIHAKMSSEALTALALAFLDDMAADGWLVGLYSCKSWLDGKLETQKICERYECWMAQYLSDGTYRLSDSYDGVYGMWQYSSSGSVEGVPGNVDMNVCFKDYPSICRQYGFNGYAATGETLVLSGMSAPQIMACGETFPISGRVTSTVGSLTNVTVGIYNEAGEMITGRSAGPRAGSYEISALASGVKLQELGAGRYEFRITATNSEGTKVLMKQPLTVSAAGIHHDGLSLPQDLKQGDSFVPAGALLASSAFEEIRIRICTDDGTEKRNVTVAPNAKEYDLSALQDSLNTHTLPVGNYTYCVEAATEKGSETLLQAAFTIWEAHDPITLSGFAMKPEYRLQELSGLTGVISSQSSPLRYVRVSIMDRTGTVVASAQCERQKKQVLLTEFRKQLALDTLPVGTYVCRIEALNAGGPCVVAEQSFLLRADAMSLCELSAPTCLRLGDTFHLNGAVTSDVSRLEFVGITVTDALQRCVLDAGAAPQSNVCDLGALGERLLFSTLPIGEYTLKISAENSGGYQTLYEETFTVTEDDDCVFWQGEHFSLAGTAFYAGDGISLWGTITSEGSALSTVSAKIYDNAGRLVTDAHKTVNGQSFSVNVLNEMLRFSALPEGSYCLRILAENGSGETVLCNEHFAITDCPHRNVCSGEVYAATCETRGAICDSRCLDCGGKVRNGMVLPKQAHSFQDGICTVCGRADYLTVQVCLNESTIRENGRYVLAVKEENGMYALGADGEAVRITVSEDGTAEVSAALLWTPILVDGNVASFVNTTGQRLHLDSRAVSIGAGSVNSALFLEPGEQGFFLRLHDCRTRCLSFADGRFQVDMSPCEVYFLALCSE